MSGAETPVHTVDVYLNRRQAGGAKHSKKVISGTSSSNVNNNDTCTFTLTWLLYITVRKNVLKLLLYLYFRTKVLKFRHDILIK